VVNHPNLLSPIDVVAERSDKQAFTKTPDAVVADDKIVDIGPDTVASFAPHIANAKFIIWNGPSGLFEEGYISWTHALAELVAQSKAKRVIGGGDTIAALQQSGVNMEALGFLSTGGGAMLEYLSKGTLPAIDALG
jgi:phosphoglycerate kinase